ncbi:hypothetical protein TREMEDRAFT_27096 [Tremella mesenterica DSM 1558]|uniref:uncharacterized protein n=1 Tax=Tremella mesenterica (strain ATCC 24925 / CBS 8224 / DSM 1558 / NBRC 9311 / NRRL Y-6157 / RJB 2259-6 / UBC 559-6) TaxID=578456 RepID=UPI0003F49F58|nr:uncharacterized protein TREMEDRAFT_27096 [Tremella mesenterica DSM 1558]EIW71459.1 hypothetical protein TREMEDRAFT_27096 [Tremella mesenterica DSM 1558]
MTAPSTLSSTEAGPSRLSPPPQAPSLRDRLVPPKHVGMTTLDRSLFTVRFPIVSYRVPASRISQLRVHPSIKGQMLDIPRVKTVDVVHDDPSLRLLRMRVESTDDLPSITKEVLRAEEAIPVSDVVELGYDYWAASEILHAVLPDTEGLDIPSAITMTGHIGHINLLDEWQPYKNLIGQVLLDKNKNLRTIVNKLNTIHAQYRYFDMEILAGDDDLITTVNEQSCSFTFDFSKVYWNSRLGSEHERLVKSFSDEEVIADVMAGVGPFAIPAAKRGCYVLGNDLNPESVKWMRHNRVQNKVEETLRVTELDGRQFIRMAAYTAWTEPFQPFVTPSNKRKALKEARRIRDLTKSSSQTSTPSPSSLSSQNEIESSPTKTPQLINHFIMNLPDSALEFLDAYRGCYHPLLSIPEFTERYGSQGDSCPMPLIHVYCFTREMERHGAERDICSRASERLNHTVSSTMENYNLHLVRSVAPGKDMYRLTFRLPKQVAFRPVEP